MPTYTFRDARGEVFDRELPLEQFRKLERNDDDQAKLPEGWCDVLVHASGGLSPCWGGWGFRSDAMGINPDQIKEQVAADRRAGVTGVKYDRRTGEAIYESRDARAKHLKAHGFFNKQAFCGRV